MKPKPLDLIKQPVLFLALGFGSGLVKKGPGTAGSAVGLLIYIPLSEVSPWIYVGLLVLGFCLGIAICGRAARRLDIKDPGCIVWDEIIGMLIACFLVPLEMVWLAITFISFRLFDIVKPWPISWCDRNLSGGLGIMLDDVLAGLAACTVVHVLMRVVVL